MSITTKFGDTGNTRLCCGDIVSKTSERIHSLGDIDMLVSMLGVAKAKIHMNRVYSSCFMIQEIETIQRKLFTIGSEVATNLTNQDKLSKKISQQDLDELDIKREQLEQNITMPTNFILPGENELSATLDVCRAMSRKLERSILSLKDQGLVQNDIMLPFVNRLSDYLYLLARNADGNQYTQL